MSRIVVDVKTGEQSIVPLTPEEVADAVARTAAEEAVEGPKRAERVEIKKLLVDAKSGAVFKAIEKMTSAQIEAWIDTEFAGMTKKQREFLSMLATAAGAYLRERG